eukprot:199646-Rhodomonas_salina.5
MRRALRASATPSPTPSPEALRSNSDDHRVQVAAISGPCCCQIWSQSGAINGDAAPKYGGDTAVRWKLFLLSAPSLRG